MRDTMMPLRHAIYAVINAAITYKLSTVPVRDERLFTGEVPDIYILMSTQQETNVDEQDCTWTTNSSITLETIVKSGSEVSKDVFDKVSNDMMELIIGLPGAIHITMPGFQIITGYRESAITQNIVIAETGQSVLRKLTTFVFKVVQQN